MGCRSLRESSYTMVVSLLYHWRYRDRTAHTTGQERVSFLPSFLPRYQAESYSNLPFQHVLYDGHAFSIYHDLLLLYSEYMSLHILSPCYRILSFWDSFVLESRNYSIIFRRTNRLCLRKWRDQVHL